VNGLLIGVGSAAAPAVALEVGTVADVGAEVDGAVEADTDTDADGAVLAPPLPSVVSLLLQAARSIEAVSEVMTTVVRLGMKKSFRRQGRRNSPCPGRVPAR